MSAQCQACGGKAQPDSVTVTKHHRHPATPTKGGSSLPDTSLARESLPQHEREADECR